MIASQAHYEDVELGEPRKKRTPGSIVGRKQPNGEIGRRVVQEVSRFKIGVFRCRSQQLSADEGFEGRRLQEQMLADLVDNQNVIVELQETKRQKIVVLPRRLK